ncbi:unnamed protein product [Diabrotica balteata]|uniref:Uncharacterized protein n=1 Tax=Diabrotica balteata TaxID=107213 RepID=A0A9N9XDQ5_DIABA|nr:unnamed protein product [Diabrotica balteata]
MLKKILVLCLAILDEILNIIGVITANNASILQGATVRIVTVFSNVLPPLPPGMPPFPNDIGNAITEWLTVNQKSIEAAINKAFDGLDKFPAYPEEINIVSSPWLREHQGMLVLAILKVYSQVPPPPKVPDNGNCEIAQTVNLDLTHEVTSVEISDESIETQTVRVEKSLDKKKENNDNQILSVANSIKSSINLQTCAVTYVAGYVYYKIIKNLNCIQYQEGLLKDNKTLNKRGFFSNSVKGVVHIFFDFWGSLLKNANGFIQSLLTANVFNPAFSTLEDISRLLTIIATTVEEFAEFYSKALDKLKDAIINAVVPSYPVTKLETIASSNNFIIFLSTISDAITVVVHFFSKIIDILLKTSAQLPFTSSIENAIKTVYEKGFDILYQIISQFEGIVEKFWSLSLPGSLGSIVGDLWEGIVKTFLVLGDGLIDISRQFLESFPTIPKDIAYINILIASLNGIDDGAYSIFTFINQIQNIFANLQIPKLPFIPYFDLASFQNIAAFGVESLFDVTNAISDALPGLLDGNNFFLSNDIGKLLSSITSKLFPNLGLPVISGGPIEIYTVTTASTTTSTTPLPINVGPWWDPSGASYPMFGTIGPNDTAPTFPDLPIYR